MLALLNYVFKLCSKSYGLNGKITGWQALVVWLVYYINTRLIRESSTHYLSYIMRVAETQLIYLDEEVVLGVSRLGNWIVNAYKNVLLAI